MRKSIPGICILFLSLMLNPALAETEIEDVVIGQKIVIHSNILDEDRPILIHIPEGYAKSEESYPVLYVLDGLTYFTKAVGILSYHSAFNVLPEMIVVGIPNTNRNRDMTPTPSNTDWEGNEVEWLAESGGADHWIRFFEEELFSYIDSNYRTQPFKTLSGHSFGGLFGMHTMLSHGNVFNAYICISTSFWYDNKVLVRNAESQLGSTDLSDVLLYLSVGGDESPVQVGPNHDFLQLLREKNPTGLEWTFDYLKNEDHGSQGLLGLIHGLEFVYSGWRMPREIIARGLDAVLSYYENVGNRLGVEVTLPKSYIEMYGFVSTREQEFDNAIQYFMYNADRYPDHPDVHLNLGGAMEEADRLDEARRAYEKALELAKQAGESDLSTYQECLDALRKKRDE